MTPRGCVAPGRRRFVLLLARYTAEPAGGAAHGIRCAAVSSGFPLRFSHQFNIGNRNRMAPTRSAEFRRGSRCCRSVPSPRPIQASSVSPVNRVVRSLASFAFFIPPASIPRSLRSRSCRPRSCSCSGAIWSSAYAFAWVPVSTCCPSYCLRSGYSAGFGKVIFCGPSWLCTTSWSIAAADDRHDPEHDHPGGRPGRDRGEARDLF